MLLVTGSRTVDCTTSEWAVVTGRIAVISSNTGESWFLDLDKFDDTLPFSMPMAGKGSLGSTAALLNGAVTLGLGGDISVLKSCATSLPQYALDLVGSYHNSGRTVGNYLKAAKRFRALGRADIASYLERHAREENGHERLALRDLNALNLPAERIVENLVPEGVASLCELFDQLSSLDYPIGCIGYSYFFESSAAKRQKADIDALQAMCPEGIDATRFMRAHSCMGSEADHVDDMIGFIANLPANDRLEIVKATYATAVTVKSNLGASAPKSDSEMWALIQAAAGEELRVGS
jgi:hypothetical protein